MSLYRGLFVSCTQNARPALPAIAAATTVANIVSAFAPSTNDLHVNVVEGLISQPNAEGTGTMTYVPSTAVLLTPPASGQATIGILQIATGAAGTTAGTITTSWATSVSSANASTLTYPAPTAGNVVLAYLFTPAAPFLSSTTAVTQANINNLALSAEFTGR